jgi:hypothetical protein
LLILGLTLAAYMPAMQAGFIWDDDANVTGNPALSEPGGFLRIWLDPRACPRYYPLTFSALSLERRLWGLDPVGCHVVSVVLHAVNALLVWAVLRADGVPGAWLAAALFPMHPIEVESVAWITELKNTLSGLFALLSLLAYARFQPLGAEAPPGRKWGWYGLSVGFFVLALLRKSVTAMLAPVLLLRAWLGRPWMTSRDLLPIAPFFVLGAVMGLNTARLELSHVGAGGSAFRLGLPERFVVAGARSGSMWGRSSRPGTSRSLTPDGRSTPPSSASGSPRWPRR